MNTACTPEAPMGRVITTLLTANDEPTAPTEGRTLSFTLAEQWTLLEALDLMASDPDRGTHAPTELWHRVAYGRRHP